MKNRLIYITLSVIILFNLSSCKKYLDELPDNRAELNTTEKITKLLVSAYPTNTYILTTEMSSDNVDDYGETNPNSDRQVIQTFNWEDNTETSNDGIDQVWSACYSSIASANQALNAIEKLGNPANLAAVRGEALVARAYSHFILVNVFAQHYSAAHSSTDLGITYMTKSEKELDPKYSRNTVKEDYDFIVKDIEEGIPLINDSYYSNPNAAKFHFNKSAANAFAARVYLYMAQWNQAIKYATASFENTPNAFVRDYAKIAGFSAVFENFTREYTSSSIKANFLITPAYSSVGSTFGDYYQNSRYAHGLYLALNETIIANGPFGQKADYRIPFDYYKGANLDKILLPHVSYQVEYTDPVAGNVYEHAVFSPFTFEEALLTRAEAYIQLKNYTAALADMQLWGNTTLVVARTLTEQSINTWANSLAYSTALASTPKKKLNPEFTIEVGTQENMLHALLFMRRIETIHTGLRWFDVKRYGIEITRRTVDGQTVTNVTQNTLGIRDKRRAIQLPKDVISAGLTPNPR